MQNLTCGSGQRRRRAGATRAGNERGAAAVEFAIIAPLLFLLMFGIIEFGWSFSQNLNVRHGAREASRLAVVNYPSDPDLTGAAQTDVLVTEICGRLDVASDVTVTLLQPDGPDAGDTVEVTVAADLQTLTGFFEAALSDTVLRSTVSSRLEQDATWAEVEEEPCP